MQWSNEPFGGFTKNAQPAVPVLSGGPYGFEHINAAIQQHNPNSLLHWTQRIIRMRKEVPAVGWGDFAVIPTRNPAVSEAARRHSQHGEWAWGIEKADP